MKQSYNILLPQKKRGDMVACIDGKTMFNPIEGKEENCEVGTAKRAVILHSPKWHHVVHNT